MWLNIVLKKRGTSAMVFNFNCYVKKQCNIISLNCLDNGLFDMITRFEFKRQQIACA